MSEMSNQWELSGDCSICRRRQYCSKPCKKSQIRKQVEFGQLWTRVLLEHFSKTDSK